MSEQNTSTQSKTQSQPWRQHWPPAPSTKTTKYSPRDMLQTCSDMHFSWLGPPQISNFNDGKSGIIRSTVNGKGASRESDMSKGLSDIKGIEEVSQGGDESDGRSE